MDKQRANLNAIADIVNELKKEYDNIYCEPAPVCCCCPQQQETSCEPPSLMVCYKVPKARGTGAAAKMKRTFRTRPMDLADSIPVKQSKSRELRGSVMYVGCDCEKRNGLQDDCQRTECHGSPECLTKPNPTCGPSRFSNGKHLGKPYPYISSRGGTVSGGSYGASVATTGLPSQNRADIDGGDVIEYEYQCMPLLNTGDNQGGATLECVCDETAA